MADRQSWAVRSSALPPLPESTPEKPTRAPQDWLAAAGRRASRRRTGDT